MIRQLTTKVKDEFWCYTGHFVIANDGHMYEAIVNDGGDLKYKKVMTVDIESIEIIESK